MKLPTLPNAAVFALFVTAAAAADFIIGVATGFTGVATGFTGAAGALGFGAGAAGALGFTGVATGFTGAAGAAGFFKKEGMGGSAAFPVTKFIAFPAAAAFVAFFSAPVFPLTALVTAAAFIFVGCGAIT